MSQEHNDPMLDKVTQQLKAGNDSLDGYVLSRLNRARQEALAQKPAKWRQWLTPGSLVPAGTLAAIVLATVMFFQQGGQEPSLVPPADDFEMIMAEESLELYEDLEFYVWLELEQSNAG